MFFDSPVVSRRHGEIFMSNHNVYLIDTNSTHGTRYSVDGVAGLVRLRPDKAQLLAEKGVLRLGADVTKDSREVPQRGDV